MVVAIFTNKEIIVDFFYLRLKKSMDLA